MLKFRNDDINHNKYKSGGSFNKPVRHDSIMDLIDFSTHEGPILDTRLTSRLEVEFLKTYEPVSITKLLGARMFRCGKKRKGQNMVGRTLNLLKRNGIVDAVDAIYKAIEKIKLPASVRIYKKGRRTVYIPYLMTFKAAFNKAARTILAVSRYHRKENGMVASLAAEIHDIHDGIGESIKRRDELQALIVSNYNAYKTIRKFRRKKGQFRK